MEPLAKFKGEWVELPNIQNKHHLDSEYVLDTRLGSMLMQEILNSGKPQQISIDV